MKKTFKTMMSLSAMALCIGAAVLTGCKKETTIVISHDDVEALANLDDLGNKFGKAMSCSDEECASEEMELVDFDTVTDDEDGTEIPVAYFKYMGEIFEMMDIDGDGTFDVAVVDANEDGEIDDDEIIDVSDDNITLDDVAEMAGVDLSEEECATDGDDEECYTNEVPEGSNVINSNSRRSNGGPARQRQEELEEQDLPDYVNNARVKAMRKH